MVLLDLFAVRSSDAQGSIVLSAAEPVGEQESVSAAVADGLHLQTSMLAAQTAGRDSSY